MGLFRDDAEVKIRSPHSPAQCLQRLRERTDPFWKIWGLPVGGRFNGDGEILLKKHTPPEMFKVILKVKIVNSDGGALVLCRAGTGIFSRVAAYIMPFIFLVAAIIFFMARFSEEVFSDASFYSRNWFPIYFFLIPSAVMTFLCAAGMYYYERDKDYLMHFVRKAVGGYGLTDSVADECP